VENGFNKDKIAIINDVFKAIDHAFSIVQPGDLIVVQVDEVGPMLKYVMDYFERIVGTPKVLSD